MLEVVRSLISDKCRFKIFLKILLRRISSQNAPTPSNFWVQKKNVMIGTSKIHHAVAPIVLAHITPHAFSVSLLRLCSWCFCQSNNSPWLPQHSLPHAFPHSNFAASGTGLNCKLLTVLTTRNNYPPPPPTGPFSAVSSGNGFTLALRVNGTVACWSDVYSQWYTGDPAFDVCKDVPTDLSHVVTIAAGWLHGIAVTVNGTVVVWGKYVSTNYYGADPQILGPAYSISVSALSGKVIAAAGGAGHSLLLLDNGKVTTWGLGTNYGQQSVPASIQIGGWARATAISTNLNNNIALLDDGTVLVWGDGGYGVLSVPSEISNVSIVTAGMDQYAAGRADSVDNWGLVISKLDWPSAEINRHIVALSAAYYQLYAMFSDGTVWRWYYYEGTSPHVLNGLVGVMAISAGPNHIGMLSGCSPQSTSPPPEAPFGPLLPSPPSPVPPSPSASSRESLESKHLFNAHCSFGPTPRFVLRVH